MTSPTTIIHADDHAFFRTGFRRAMEQHFSQQISFIEDAKNGAELVEKVYKYKPDLVVTDIKMPGMDGIEACRLIKKQSPETAVIALSAVEDEQCILNMITAGANGYLTKNVDKDEMIDAVTTVRQGMPYYCSEVSEKMYKAIDTFKRRKQKDVQFSLQEIRIMQLVCQQLTIKEISDALKLKMRTVEDHRRRLQEKIGARNMIGIALYAIINHIVDYNTLSGVQSVMKVAKLTQLR
jgi:DNA-binding NarL/FixJ family response regulator